MNLQCKLCPKFCVIRPGQSGECRVRVNIDDRLCAVTYGYPSSVHVDPVEKKPLYHFMPGTSTFSIATVGCNLHCKNCQNWEISQANPEESTAVHLSPGRIPEAARRNRCLSVSYTYTDPVVYYEYALDGCVEARKAGLKNILVTAGYMNEEPARELYAHVDAANIDIKSMSDKFYREVCDATLKPVLNTLAIAMSLDVHVEVTNLVIPTLNDRDEEMETLCRWVSANLGRETPLHFSRFFPHYRMRHLPPTPADTLVRAREIAFAAGLHHVYIGNILVKGSSDTSCPSCREPLIRRTGYNIDENRLKNGRCPKCGKEIHGVWE